MKIFRLSMAIMLLISMLSLSILNLYNGDWKSFVLGILYSTANVIIFII